MEKAFVKTKAVEFMIENSKKDCLHDVVHKNHAAWVSVQKECTNTSRRLSILFGLRAPCGLYSTERGAGF